MNFVVTEYRIFFPVGGCAGTHLRIHTVRAHSLRRMRSRDPAASETERRDAPRACL